MKALVYHGPGSKSWEEVPRPTLRGDTPEVAPGRILGHEAVGTVEEVGAAVKTLHPGDRVLVSCISSCGRCRFCREGRYGQCLGGGGWILGYMIDGTQAEYV